MSINAGSLFAFSDHLLKHLRNQALLSLYTHEAGHDRCSDINGFVFTMYIH